MSTGSGSIAAQAAQAGITVDELRERYRLENIAARATPSAPSVQRSEISMGALPIDTPAPARPAAITLPWSTLRSVNGTWTIRSSEYQAAKRRAREKIAERLGAWHVLDCRIAVDVVLFVPDQRPRDLDNYEKLIYDALKGLVYRDDSLIDDKRMRRDYDVDRPRAEIKVTPLAT